MPETSETPETPETAPPPDPGASAPRAPTNIDALHDLKAREGTQVATELGLRQVLYVLDPHPNDHALTYAEVLGRLQTVLTRELQTQAHAVPEGEPDGTL